MSSLDAHGNMDRRTKTYRDLIGVMPKDFAEEIDGEVYEYKREHRCKVCSAPRAIRDTVDALLVAGHTYSSIYEKVQGLQPPDVSENKKISYWSIRNHQKRHLPFDKLAAREIAERRAAEKGKAILNGKHNIITAEAVYEYIVQAGYERMVNGLELPDIDETMKAAALLDRLEKDASGMLDRQLMLVKLNAIIDAVREEVPAEMWGRIVQRIERAQHTLSSGYQTDPAEFIDADVVDETA